MTSQGEDMTHFLFLGASSNQGSFPAPFLHLHWHNTAMLPSNADVFCFSKPNEQPNQKKVSLSPGCHVNQTPYFYSSPSSLSSPSSKSFLLCFFFLCFLIFMTKWHLALDCAPAPARRPPLSCRCILPLNYSSPIRPLAAACTTASLPHSSQ